MNRSIHSLAAIIALGSMSAVVFAKAGAAGSAPPPPPATDTAPPAPPAQNVGLQPGGLVNSADAAAGLPAGVTTDGGTKPRNVSPIRTDIPPPASKKSGPRAGQSLYDFDKLEINGSFGILDKTKNAKKFASTVTAANHRYDAPVLDAAGNPTFKPGAEIKDANGNVTGNAKGKPIMKATRKFVCADVDPAKDPDGATVRVWRVAIAENEPVAAA